jgi:hypothetical protein
MLCPYVFCFFTDGSPCSPGRSGLGPIFSSLFSRPPVERGMTEEVPEGEVEALRVRKLMEAFSAVG